MAWSDRTDLVGGRRNAAPPAGCRRRHPAAWAGEGEPERRRALPERVHARAYEVLPYINGGQFRTNAAWRTDVTGIRPTTVPVFRGVRKE